MGNWTFDVDDDFTLPSGRESAVFDTANMKGSYDYAMKCKTKNEIESYPG